MNPTVIALATVALAGLALAALFAAAETALVTINRTAIRERAERGEPAAARMDALLADPHTLFHVTLVGWVFALVLTTLALQGLLTLVPLGEKGDGRWLGLLLTTALMTVLALVPGSAWPRAIARRHAEATVLRFARPLAIFRALALPLERLLRWVIHRAVWLLRLPWEPRRGPISKQEVLELAARSEREGGLETTERRMIQRILTLHRTLVREIMQPLIRVVAIRESELTWEHLGQIARSTGHSRFPVYRTVPMDLIGHIDIYEALAGDRRSPEEIRALMSPPHYVPEVKRVDDLLQEFLREGRRVAIVVDEHGACSGWVTLEDILEEIFGEIADEFDRARPRWVTDEQGGVLIEAGLDLDDFNAQFGLAFPKGHCDTLGGFIYEHLGRVPVPGDAVRHGGRTLRVYEMEPPRILRVRLEPPDSHAP